MLARAYEVVNQNWTHRLTPKPVILVLCQQFSNRPNVVSQTRSHRRSSTQTRMNTAEIVVGKVQSDGGFQMRQLLAERIGQARKPSTHHAKSQVLPFDVRSRDVAPVGITGSDLGYSFHEPWWS